MATLQRPPPFRAEHIGSLLRPMRLLAIRMQLASTGVPPETTSLAEAEKKSVGDAVKMQRDLGLKCITSGEFGRTLYWGSTWDEFEGTVPLKDPPEGTFRLYYPGVAPFVKNGEVTMPSATLIAGGKLSHNPGKSVSNMKELLLIQELVPKDEWRSIKLTMITPAFAHMWYSQGKAYTHEAYANDAEYFKDVAKVYAAEINQLYEAGLRNIQFDDPLPFFCDARFRDGWAADPTNIGTVDDLFDSYMALYNDIFSQCPADLHRGIHLCRGNYVQGTFFSQGAYDIIAERLFNNLNVNTYYLEYDTSRAGSFEPLQFLPKNKNVVIGIISTKLPEIEDKEEMKRRIFEAADCVARGGGETREEALRRMSVSPQCGFSSIEMGYPLSQEDQTKKLVLLRELADEIWGEP